MSWSRRTKTEYPHRLVHPPRGFNRLSPTPNPLSPFFSNTCAFFCTSLHFFALFCTHQKLNSFIFNQLRTLCKNTRGCGALLQPRAPRRGRRHAEQLFLRSVHPEFQWQSVFCLFHHGPQFTNHCPLSSRDSPTAASASSITFRRGADAGCPWRSVAPR